VQPRNLDQVAAGHGLHVAPGVLDLLEHVVAAPHQSGRDGGLDQCRDQVLGVSSIGGRSHGGPRPGAGLVVPGRDVVIDLGVGQLPGHRLAGGAAAGLHEVGGGRGGPHLRVAEALDRRDRPGVEHHGIHQHHAPDPAGGGGQVLGDTAADVVGGEVEALPAERVGDPGDDAGERRHGGLLDVDLPAAAAEARQVERDAAVPSAQDRQDRLPDPAPERAVQQEQRRRTRVARGQAGQQGPVDLELLPHDVGAAGAGHADSRAASSGSAWTVCVGGRKWPG